MGTKQKDGIQLERSFLLRLPEPQAEMVRKTLHAGFVKDYLSIEFQADNRHSTVRVGKSCLTGKLMDLPSIVESLKTVDKKSFYKTADICQMLVCTDESDEPNVDVEETSEQTSHKKDKKFVFNHGVTPPLKNVRKRRFRKTARKKHQECPEVEKELKRLLRADVQAESVTFEVLADEEKNEENPSLISSPLGHHGDEIDHLAFLQEPMSDEEDELDIENIQKETPSSSQLSTASVVDETRDTSLNFKEKQLSQAFADKTSQPVSYDAIDDCEELRKKIEAQKARIENAENPFLKQRFQSTLEKLEQQLKERESKATQS
ncbi:transcription initiation factor TFIID subunit 7-like [Dendronephthya gigantea]|uniref:transcription initiation factor TFIID subunit 7-like n=1 Tax=Dendronephthya gigantea TaxID=151771 RepID=UPI001069B043|nr:transcription initiation factor TFIID subunit 7-like [Dendronephthya gigantea]